MNKDVENMKIRTMAKISTVMRYGKQVKVETTEEEFNTYTKIKVLDSLETIKKIMIFFFIVMIINLFCTILLLLRIV